MDNKEFKIIFNDVAKKFNFEKAFGGWFAESSECIVVLDLQKSNFGDYYYLNIKIYVQYVFSKIYKKSKELVKREVGNIPTRPPNIFDEIFDFDISIDDNLRKQKLEQMFINFLQPFTNLALTRKGIHELEQKSEIFILPAVKEELERLDLIN